MKNELHDLIIKGKIDKVIYKLRDELVDKSSRLFHQVILIGFGWEELKADRNSGRLSQENINLEKNRLISNLLNLIEDVQSVDFVQTKQISHEAIGKKEEIGLGLSINIALGYYYNFLKKLNDSLNEKVIQLAFDASTGKIVQTKNIKIEIWVPFPEPVDYASMKEISDSENLKMITIPTTGRSLGAYGRVDDEKVTLIDIPTSLNSIKSVYQMFQDKYQFDATIEKEIELFIESLEFLISLDENMKNRIRIVKK